MIVTDHRFTVEAEDQLDRLIAVFIAAAEGRQEEAKAAFQTLTLTPQIISDWSDDKKTIAHYFANRLATYHLPLEAEVMDALAQTPHLTPGAQAWWEAIRRDMGWPHQAVAPAPPSGDGFRYVNWILGFGVKSTAGSWGQVPLG